MKLLIVESPTKEKTISQFIGKDYEVVSTNGHLFQLSKESDAKHEFGINFKTLEIKNNLIPKKRKLFQKIKQAHKAGKELIFATDNDREGEAISYILAKKLKIDQNLSNRLVFNEISSLSINEGLKHLQKIDILQVNSQKARRILDRIIGFRTARQLMNYYGSQGAGRVQSVVLKFIAERDDQIQKFNPKSYFVSQIILAENLALNEKKIQEGNLDFKYLKKYCDDVTSLKAKIIEIAVSEVKTAPPRPYKTSTLIQDAYIKFGYSSVQTMALAQQLYSGVKIERKQYGLITYLRTDSYRISTLFVQKMKKYLGTQFYIKSTDKKHEQKKEKHVQDAHEAIRPVYLNNVISLVSLKKILKPQLWKMYKLIYDRTISVFSPPAIKKNYKYSVQLFEQPVEKSSAKDQISTKQNPTTFTLSISKYKQKGWKQYTFDKDLEITAAEQKFIDTKKVNAICDVASCKLVPKTTKSPALYNQASIIKLMDSLKIGRPSTYSSIIQKLEKHNYVMKRQQKLKLTIRGRETNKVLQKHYSSVFNENFTASMEEQLTKIREEKYDYKHMIYEVNDEMKSLVEKAAPQARITKSRFLVAEGEKCPNCKGLLHLIISRGVDYLICKNMQYNKKKGKKNDSLRLPKKTKSCDYIQKVNYLKILPVGRKCEKCGSELVVRRNGKFHNLFVGCSSFPKCRNIINCRWNKELQEIIKKLYPAEDVFF